jgi:hypothetical protein
VRQAAFRKQPVAGVEQRPARLLARRARRPWVRVVGHAVDCPSYKQRSQGGSRIRAVCLRERFGSPPRSGGGPDRRAVRVVGPWTPSPTCTRTESSMTSSQSASARDVPTRKPPWPVRHPVTGRATSDLLTRPPRTARVPLP